MSTLLRSDCKNILNLLLLHLSTHRTRVLVGVKMLAEMNQTATEQKVLLNQGTNEEIVSCFTGVFSLCCTVLTVVWCVNCFLLFVLEWFSFREQEVTNARVYSGLCTTATIDQVLVKSLTAGRICLAVKYRMNSCYFGTSKING